MSEAIASSVDGDLRQELAAVRAELLAAAPRLRELERLRREMRWDAAPPALRWLLPIARLLHRPEPEPVRTPEVAGTASPMIDPPAAASAAAPLPPPSRMRGAMLSAYRLARPVMRPVARRSRMFLTGELMLELADARAKLDLLLARLPEEGAEPGGTLDAGAVRAAERMLLTFALESRDAGPRS